ncbi:hypothetical protein ACVWZX_003675 [Deinococcus sp. UYEF24]
MAVLEFATSITILKSYSFKKNMLSYTRFLTASKDGIQERGGSLTIVPL